MSLQYSFKAKIASRGYHVFKENSWSNAKEGDEVKVELETNKSSNKIYLCHSCERGILQSMENSWPHPERNFEACLFFYKIRGRFCQRDSNINKIPHVTNTSWWIRNSIVTHVSCSKAINFGEMKTFVQTLYDYNFNGTVIEEENSDDEDEIKVINESDSRTVNNCIQLIGYGYSDSENEDKKQDGSEESNSEYEGENQDGSEESNSEDENENQGRNNIPVLNDENEIEILLITE